MVAESDVDWAIVLLFCRSLVHQFAPSAQHVSAPRYLLLGFAHQGLFLVVVARAGVLRACIGDEIALTPGWAPGQQTRKGKQHCCGADGVRASNNTIGLQLIHARTQ